MPSFLYVSIAGEDKISIYTRDAVSGRLAFERDIPHADRPSPMAVDPQQQYLYVGRRRPGAFGLSSFRIDGGEPGLVLYTGAQRSAIRSTTLCTRA